MNRAELVRQVAARSGLPLAAADAAVKAALDAVAGALADLEAGGRCDGVGEAVDMVAGALSDRLEAVEQGLGGEHTVVCSRPGAQERRGLCSGHGGAAA